MPHTHCRPEGNRRLRLTTAIVVAIVASGLAQSARAATSEQLCQRGRYSAAAKFAACHQKVLGLETAGMIEFGYPFQAALAKCRERYAKVWSRLASHYPTTTCDTARFQAHVDGTVTDHLTGLQWEQKTDDESRGRARYDSDDRVHNRAVH